MTLTFCPPDTTQMCIYQSFLITRKFTIIPLKLCSCAWLDHELFTNILFFAFRFSTETGVIEITLPWRVSFFNIFAVLYDVYVWCFTVYGDVAWFFSIDTTTTWLPFTQFFVSESVLQINIQVLLFFFHVFCKTHLIILLQSEVPMEKYLMILRSHMTSP